MLRRRVFQGFTDCRLKRGQIHFVRYITVMDFDFKNLVPNIEPPPYLEPISVSQTRRVVEATGEVKDSLNVLVESSSRLETLTSALIETSRDSHKQIMALNESSTKLEGLTATLITETGNVRSQVVVLTASSHNIERLTTWIIWLTVVLGILTLILVLDVANKFRQEYFSEPPRLTAPQTPTLPPR